MEVTQSNFDDLLPLVIESIDSADFISCDGEFTGLSSIEGMSSYEDSIQERYCKNAADVRRLALIQFGISCFKYSEQTKSYKCATFSFYLMKKKTNGLPQLFSSCVNSMRFLSSSDFDFNKLFKDGLTYANRSEIVDLKKEMQIYYDKETNFVMEEKRTLRQENHLIYNQIVDFIKNCRVDQTSIIKSNLHQPKRYMELLLEDINGVGKLNEAPNFLVPNQTIKVFKLENRSDLDNIKQLLMNEFHHILVSYDADRIEISVKVMSNVEERDYFVAVDALKKFYQSVGFSRVLYRILEKGKDLVGHNCYLDLFYLVDKFIEPLPELLSDFKTIYKDNFTNVIDTKFIATSELNLPNTSLFSVFSGNKCLCPKVEALPGCLTYPVDGSSRAHDAGYDSFITGVAYIAMMERINKEKNCIGIRCSVVKRVSNVISISKLINKTSMNLKKADDHNVPDHFCVSSKNKLSINFVDKLFPTVRYPTLKSDSRKKILVYPTTAEDMGRIDDILREALILAAPHIKVTKIRGFKLTVPMATKKSEPIAIPMSNTSDDSMNDSRHLSTGNSFYFTPTEDSFSKDLEVFGSTPIKDVNKLHSFKLPLPNDSSMGNSSEVELREDSLTENQNRRGAKRKSGNKVNDYDSSSDTIGPDSLDGQLSWNIVNRRKKNNGSEAIPTASSGGSSTVTRSKRVSSAKSSDESDQSDVNQRTVKRDFKRMKSVGSEALQNLSLESPVETKNTENFFAAESQVPNTQPIPPSKPVTRKVKSSSGASNGSNRKNNKRNQGRNRGQSRGTQNSGRSSKTNFFKETPDWA